MLNKLNAVKSYLEANFLERENVIRGLLAGIIAQENTLLIGGAGTGKSNLVMELSKCITNINYFQWLMTKYTTPEELFGAVLLSELEKGVYKRNTKNKLPEAHIAFSDEIFKSNSAILNAKLTLLNERIFYNNGGIVQSPLMSLIGASNEYPEEDEGLEALDDRFVLRFEVLDISDKSNFMHILAHGIDTSKRPVGLDLTDIEQLQKLVDAVTVDQGILETFIRIKDELDQEGIHASTRRWRKSLQVVKANAVLNGNTNVDFNDLDILKDILWTRPHQMKLVQSIVAKYCTDTFTGTLKDLLQQVDEIHKNAMRDKTTEAGMEANQKIKSILKELEELKAQNPAKVNQVDNAIQKATNLNKEILKECLGLM